MKPLLILLIAIALVMTAQKRESALPDPIGPTDELIDRELLKNAENNESPD